MPRLHRPTPARLQTAPSGSGGATPPKAHGAFSRWREGSTCVILAGGPSLTEEDVHHVQAAHTEDRCKVIAVNDAWQLAPWADLLYACDSRWWDAKRPPPDVAAPRLRVSQDEVACARHGLVYVPSVASPGLCRTPWTVHQGGNSGYQAINLAFHFGARRILLLGFDMQRTDGKSHWFGDHPPGLQVPSPFQDFIRRFGPLAQDLSDEGVTVINCSAQTALTCFPRHTISQALSTE